MTGEAETESSVMLHPSRSIQECQIDLLLEEEFAAEPQFVRSFLAECKFKYEFIRVDQVSHSVSDKHGEADLVVIIDARNEVGDDIKFALLIEDKINASFQPEQGERYKYRGDEGKEHGIWNGFLTVLVAPASYIKNAHDFNAEVTLEKIKEWVCPSDPARKIFKQKKIDEAIQKKNSTGVQIVDVNMTIFRENYYNYLMDFNKRYGLDFSTRAPGPIYYGDTWFILKSVAYLPEWAEIRHMMPSGNIEINFKKRNLSNELLLNNMIDSDMLLTTTGINNQHATIRIKVPTIKQFDSFEREHLKVEAVLLNAKRLLDFFTGKKSEIESLLIPAPTFSAP